MAFGQKFINIRFTLHWMPVEIFEPTYVFQYFMWKYLEKWFIEMGWVHSKNNRAEIPLDEC